MVQQFPMDSPLSIHACASACLTGCVEVAERCRAPLLLTPLWPVGCLLSCWFLLWPHFWYCPVSVRRLHRCAILIWSYGPSNDGHAVFLGIGLARYRPRSLYGVAVWNAALVFFFRRRRFVLNDPNGISINLGFVVRAILPFSGIRNLTDLRAEGPGETTSRGAGRGRRRGATVSRAHTAQTSLREAGEPDCTICSETVRHEVRRARLWWRWGRRGLGMRVPPFLGLLRSPLNPVPTVPVVPKNCCQAFTFNY